MFSQSIAKYEVQLVETKKFQPLLLRFFFFLISYGIDHVYDQLKNIAHSLKQ